MGPTGENDIALTESNMGGKSRAKCASELTLSCSCSQLQLLAESSLKYRDAAVWQQ